MTYQVCILDIHNKYHVLLSTADGLAAQTYYTARISELFAVPVATTENTFKLSLPCMGMEVANMFTVQSDNLKKIVPDPVSFLMTVCF